jgi:hypothetical protein
LVGSAISKEHHCAVRFVEVLLGERKPGSDWNLGTNDAIPAVEVCLLSVVVHRATLSVRRTSPLRKHLSHNLPWSVTSEQGNAVIPVGSDDAIIKGSGGVDSLVDSFLN